MTESTAALLQGIYYLVTGLFPFISMRAFESITGPKTDHWLVKTTGLLIVIIGLTILYSRISDPFPTATIFLAVGSAIGLGLIDVVYVTKGTISKVYLADAAAQTIVIILWSLS